MVLHRALETAVSWGLLSRNPADQVKSPRPGHHEWHPFDEVDARHLLEASREHALYPVFYLAIGTGMRRSEIMGLRWCDVDLTRCQLYVNRSLHQLHTREIVICAPKTARSRRTVALSAPVVEVLRRYRARREAETVVLGVSLSEQDLVFANPDGSQIRPDYVTRTWAKMAAKCGFPGVRLHDARHLHASLLLKQGIHPAIVQARLGHASIAVTMDLYSHISPGLQEAAARSLDELVFTEPPEAGPAGNY